MSNTLSDFDDFECVCVRSSCLKDWYIIERLDHVQLSDALVEGTGEQMLALAKAIEERGRYTAKRCAVDVQGNVVYLWSPRNSQEQRSVTLTTGNGLVRSIRAVVTVEAEQ